MASVGACPERAQRVEGSRITLVNVIESIGLTSFPGSVGGLLSFHGGAPRQEIIKCFRELRCAIQETTPFSE
jgi:hypothetical protein